MLTTTTPSAGEPLDLAAARAWLRLTDVSEDAIVTELIIASRRRIEAMIGRTLINTSFLLTLDGFPCGGIRLPRSPLISLDSISYTDIGEAPATIGNPVLATHADGTTSAFPPLSSSWPATFPGSEVEVSFTAGLAADAESVPEDIRLALKMLLADAFEHRQSSEYGQGSFANAPTGVADLLSPWTRVVC